MLLAEAMTTAEVLMTAMMMLITVLLAGGIPWAYVIGQKVTRIESKLTNGIPERIERHSDGIDDLTRRLQVLETLLSQNPEHARRVRERQQGKGS